MGDKMKIKDLNKKTKIIIAASLFVLILIVIVLCFALRGSKQVNNENEQPKTSQSENKTGDAALEEETNNETKEAEKEEETKNNEVNHKETLNEGNGPVNTVSGDDIVSMIDEFNTLEDGDARKEELRKQIQGILDSANGTTLK